MTLRETHTAADRTSQNLRIELADLTAETDVAGGSLAQHIYNIKIKNNL